MKYIIRSIKSFIFFGLITLLVTFLVFQFGKTENITEYSDLFKEGALVHMLLFFAVFAAIYPAISFYKRKVYLNGDYSQYKQMINESFITAGYELLNEDMSKITYRRKSIPLRLTRMFEDKIEIHLSDNPIVIEGLRKDIVRIASNIEYKIAKEEGTE